MVELIVRPYTEKKVGDSKHHTNRNFSEKNYPERGSPAKD
jgi:hypothetical protein